MRRLQARIWMLCLLITLLTAGLASNDANATNGTQSSCNLQNPMIQYLQRQGVQINQKPNIENRLCPNEWGTHKSCCDQWTLGIHIRKKLLANKWALKSLNFEIRDIPKKLIKFTLAHLNKSQVEEHFSVNRRIGNGIQFSTSEANTKQTRTQSEFAFQELKKFRKYLAAYTNSSLTRQRLCVNKINEVISGSTCSICSGRSDSFFKDNYKLKISESLCRSVLANCTDAWNDMIHIAEQVRNYTGTIQALSGSSSNMGARAFTMNLDGFVRSSRIKQIITACGSNDLENCSFTHVSSLCEQFIHIKSSTYVANALSQSRKLSSGVFALRSSLKRMRATYRQRLSLLEKLLHKTLDTQWYLEALNKLAEFSTRVEAMKTHWLSLKLKQAWMEYILESSPLKHGVISKAVEVANQESTTIVTDVVDATLLLHSVIRKAMDSLRNKQDSDSKQLLTKFKEKWSILESIAEEKKTLNYQSKAAEEFYKDLRHSVKTQQSKSLAKADPFVKKLTHLFEKAVEQRIGEVLPPRSKDGRKLQADGESLSPVPVAQPEGAAAQGKENDPPGTSITDTGVSMLMSSEEPPADVNVIKDTQCDPCLGVDLEFLP